MQLEKQVVSLELAKKLKELGVKQKSLFWWCPGVMEYGYEGEWKINETDDDRYFLFDHIVGHEFDEYDFKLNDVEYWEDEMTDLEARNMGKRNQRRCQKFKSKIVSAFTVAELLQMLLDDKKLIELYQNAGQVMAKYFHMDCYGTTTADALAELIIKLYLLENKLITLN